MPGKDGSAAEEFGISNVVLETDTTEAPETEAITEQEETVTEEVTEEAAPEEAGKTVEGEGGETEEKKILGKFKTQEDLEKSYKELESSWSKSNQRRVELEDNEKAMRPLVEEARRIMEENAKPKEAELTPVQFREKYFEVLAEDPKKAQAMLLNTPEAREVIAQAVNEIAKPFVESQNKRVRNELIEKLGKDITVENDYPVNFNEAVDDIERMGERRPWLRVMAREAGAAGEGESFYRYLYSLWLQDNPDRLQGWNKGAGKQTTVVPPITETGGGGSPKGQTQKSPEEQIGDAIVQAGPKGRSEYLF